MTTGWKRNGFYLVKVSYGVGPGFFKAMALIWFRKDLGMVQGRFRNCPGMVEFFAA